MRWPFLMIFSSFVIAMTSCDDAVYFEENESIAEGKWKANEGKTFEFDIQDTNSLYNFYVNLRNGEEYAYRNLYVFIEMEFPNGKKSIDTLDCPLADPMGNWYGSGLGKIYDNRILFRERKRFPLSGRYKVEIFQAMRHEELDGIYDVGFRLAKSN